MRERAQKYGTAFFAFLYSNNISFLYSNKTSLPEESKLRWGAFVHEVYQSVLDWSGFWIDGFIETA